MTHLTAYPDLPPLGLRPPLTQRERQIARLVASGETNRAIAETLDIAEKTVEKHMTRIFVKLRLRSRTQVATYTVAHDSALR